MKSHWQDILLSIWILLAAVSFFAPLLLIAGSVELELVGRYVYLCVVATGLVYLAVRALRAVRR